jgi:hypothetical protein
MRMTNFSLQGCSSSSHRYKTKKYNEYNQNHQENDDIVVVRMLLPLPNARKSPQCLEVYLVLIVVYMYNLTLSHTLPAYVLLIFWKYTCIAAA